MLDTGYYQFSLILTSDGVQGSMELLYRRSVYCSMEPSEEGTSVLSRSSYLVEQKWSEEQINDFVRKLGFLDAEGESGVKIGHFLYLSQVIHLCAFMLLSCSSAYVFVFTYVGHRLPPSSLYEWVCIYNWLNIITTKLQLVR